MAFNEKAQPKKASIEDFSPWKVLGRKWHLAEKGFTRKPRWPMSMLSELVRALEEEFSEGRWDWTNKTVVTAWVKSQPEPVFQLHTKRPDGVDLTLITRPGEIALGRIAELGTEREIVPHRHGEAVRIRFTKLSEAKAEGIVDLLGEFAETERR